MCQVSWRLVLRQISYAPDNVLFAEEEAEEEREGEFGVKQYVSLRQRRDKLHILY